MKTHFLLFFACLSMLNAVSQEKPATPKSVKDTVKQHKEINLKEVGIKARRPLIQMEIDKTVVNVGSMISAAGSNTLEVLEKTPGVTVSPSGEISLNGKSGVKVLIDGKSNYMSGSDLANYLKSLPGASLDKIELIDNPSSKYDAAGNAVINIRLKREREGGTTGTISTSYSQGKYARNNQTLNINHNRNKLNLYTNLSYSGEQNYGYDDFDRRFFDSALQVKGTVDLHNAQKSNNHGLNSTLGLDYTAAPNTIYGLSLNLSHTKGAADFNFESRSYNAVQELKEMGSGITFGKNTRTNSGAGLSMVHKFATEGQEFSADVNYLSYQADGRQDLNNMIYPSGASIGSQSAFLYLLPSSTIIYAAKADYVHVLKDKGRLEAGLKTSFVQNDNNNKFFQVDGTDQTLNNSRSNHFKYQENISAAYLTYQRSWAQLGLQLGVRVEHTAYAGKEPGNSGSSDNNFDKGYTNVIPNLMLNYKFDKVNRNTLGFVILRRLNRPNYQLLNPFLFYKDQYTYNTGNPELGPQLQDRVELKYQHKQLLNMGLSYNRFAHVIFQTTEAVGDVFTTEPQNVASGRMLLLNVSLSASPVSWWYLNYTGRFSHAGLKGQVYTEQLDFSTNIVRLELNNSFTLNSGWSAELGGYYASSDLNGQLYTNAMYRVNAGIQKKLFKNKASIRLSADDIFHSWVYEYRSLSLKQAEYFQTSETDTQRIGLSFSYRFGNELFSRKNRHNNNASDEEKSRL